MTGQRASPARGLSLDVDGTLYRIATMRVAWRLRRERHVLFALMAAREKIRYEPPLEGWEALAEREAELVGPSLGVPSDQARSWIAEVQSRLSDALARGMRPHRGVRSALEVAASRGLRLATLSDFEPLPKLALLGLEDLPWMAHVGAYRLGGLKPHPQPFLRVCEQLGLTPCEVVHVGDSEDQDVRGALNAGLRAWRFAPHRWPRTAAERTFSRWTLDLFTPLIAPADESR